MTRPIVGHDSAPPLGLSPRRPRRKKGKHVYTCKKKWKGKLGKVQKVQKEVTKYVTNQSRYGRERKEEKKKFWGVIPKGWGIGMLT